MRPLVLLGVALLTGATRTAAQTTPLVIFNAAALGPPFRDVLSAMTKRDPGVRPVQENSPSLEAVRKLTELDRVPDVLAVADETLLPQLVVPGHARWYVAFATNAMVLAYTDRSIGAREITTANWWQVLLRPGVRVGRSDPAVDPSGYRAIMAVQLAERHYRQPGLAAKLLAAMPSRYIRHAEADLSALVQAGELDYGWTYRSLAIAHGLQYVELPREIDQSAPALAAWYAQVAARIGGPPGTDSLTIRGAPITFALTVPARAAHAATGQAFARFLLSAEGRAILERSGLRALAAPVFHGDVPELVRR